MQKTRILQIAAGLMISLFGIVGVIIYLARSRIITPEMAMLMLVALLGFYFGFGVLILTYRIISRLE